MSASPPPASYESMATPPEERPAKRQKTLACGRCRRRKQKCDEQRPCTNCSKSGETCHEVVPRLGLGTMPYTQMALPSPVDISSLEERVAKLEKAQILAQQWQPNQKPTRNSSHSGYYRGVPSPDGTFTSTNSPPNHGASPSVYSCHGSPNASMGAFQARAGGSGQPLQFSGSPSGFAGQDYTQRPGSSLSGSAPAIGLLATFARPDGNRYHGNPQQQQQPHQLTMNIDRTTEMGLFEVYRTRIHSRYAFLDLESLKDPLQRSQDLWVGFFTNMVYSIGMLLNGQQSHLAFYRLAVTRHLSHVFAQPDRILHVQAHLLLAMHALHSPSTERLVSIAGATMRYCVLAGLHAAEEDEAKENETFGNSYRAGHGDDKIQLRRRVFWSAYALDRVVSTTFDLPPSVSDGHITAELYSGEEDTALMYVKGLRLQSKALGFRLCQKRSLEEETKLLNEIQDWGELCRQKFPAAEWLQLTYHVGLATLFGSELHQNGASTPNISQGDDTVGEDGNCNSITVAVTPQSSVGSAGDGEHEGPDTTAQIDQQSNLALDKIKITRDSTRQACLLFRHLQRSTAAAGSERSWLALIAQFKCGVSLLHRSQEPGSRSLREDGDLAQAISACSASLSALARHWPQSRCLSDVFSLVLGESHFGGGSHESRGQSTGKRTRDGRDDRSKSVADWLPILESIVMHRPTLKMIRKLAATRKSPPSPRSGSYVSNRRSSSRGADEVSTANVLKLETPSSVMGDDDDVTRDESLFGLGLDGREDDGMFRAASPTFFLPDPPRPASEVPERDYRFDYLDLGGPDEPITCFGASLQI
ncbi:hypothetical protein MCOR27_003405 [Pyricularia oryzae]|uniref:Zn(2)-C6 fungal-type domain-containing protein n=1 Tax=Pyricularia grisea TaxID=148305 RepID=A0ABQ8NP95_PYRGI|nr:hypothetical protein MCOR27_003405 [Pyricularia oryzae]KAI6299897.1 hypothetical protein MCOR33_004285 [Pyricularia grisea]KAI6370775.1 hypothetical protein MCOR31_004431 [Pyricularia oryzae]KAI6425343.1 hypothetical protein MCOR24_003130 [Pyricularia oryzae]KAI6429359.1 hypothetical protein MCOR21_005046 [Pyricularia oryzae]